MRLPRLFTPERRSLFALLVGNGLAQGALAVASAWLVMGIFDNLAAGEGRSAPMFVVLGLAILGAALLRRRERIDAEHLGQHYVTAVRQRLYARLLATSPRAFSKRRKGSLLLKFVGDLSALRRWISLGLARLLVAGIAISIVLAALGWMFLPFALGVALIVTASAGWILWQSSDLRAAIGEARRRQASLSANVTEKLSHMATVQAFGQMRREQSLLRRQSDRLLEASVRKAAKIGLLRALIDATAGMCVLFVLVMAYLVPPQELSPGMVVAVISIIGFLTPPLRDLGRVQEYWLAAQVAHDNLQKLAEQAPPLRNRCGGEPLEIAEGRITFHRVSVRGALRRVSAEARPGSRVAVVGPNASGKSTLLGLVGRLFDPDKGRVLIDEQNIAKVQLASLRRQVGYVSADIPLMRGSLRKNLSYGAGRVDAKRLQEVVNHCGLTELIERLPHGLDTRIAEGGGDLSQGERMRVGLARALLLAPRVLLLDEADAHLDCAAVNALDRVIHQFEGTLLMVTHRSAALGVCDSVWTLKDGRIEHMASGGVGLAHPAGVVVLHDRAPTQRLVVTG